MASGSLLLTYAINFGLPFCIWYRVLPVDKYTGVRVQVKSSCFIWHM